MEIIEKIVGIVTGNKALKNSKSDMTNNKEELSFDEINKNHDEEEKQDQIDYFRKEVIKELVKISYPETHRIMEDCFGDMLDLNRDFIIEGQSNWLDKRDIARKSLTGEELDKATIRVYEYEKSYKEELSSYVGLYQSDNIAWGYLKLKMQKENERLMDYFVHTADVEKNFPHIETLLQFSDIVKPRSAAAIKNILSKKPECKNLTVTEFFKSKDNELKEAVFDELNLEYFKYKKKLAEYTRWLCAKVNKYKVILGENIKQDLIYKNLYETSISDLPTDIIKSRLQLYNSPKSKMYHKHGKNNSLMFYDDFEERRLEIIEEKRQQEEAEENKD